MKYLLITILICAIVSCGGTENGPEKVDFDDFAGETGTLEDTSEQDLVTEEDNLSSMNQLVKQMIAVYDTTKIGDSHPLDRFTYSTSRKVRFIGKEDVPYGSSSMVTPTADFFYYSFADSNKTVSAFYNYLDVMAEEGEGGPVKLNEDVEAIKMPPMFMVVYDTIIVSAKYKCEHEKNDWNSFQDSIISIYGKDFKYQIDVDCGGPLKWK